MSSNAVVPLKLEHTLQSPYPQLDVVVCNGSNRGEMRLLSWIRWRIYGVRMFFKKR